MVSQRPPNRKVQDAQKLSPKQKMLNGILLSNARPMCRSQTTGKNRRRTKSLGEKARENRPGFGWTSGEPCAKMLK